MHGHMVTRNVAGVSLVWSYIHNSYIQVPVMPPFSSPPTICIADSLDVLNKENLFTIFEHDDDVVPACAELVPPAVSPISSFLCMGTDGVSNIREEHQYTINKSDYDIHHEQLMLSELDDMAELGSYLFDGIQSSWMHMSDGIIDGCQLDASTNSCLNYQTANGIHSIQHPVFLAIYVD